MPVGSQVVQATPYFLKKHYSRLPLSRCSPQAYPNPLPCQTALSCRSPYRNGQKFRGPAATQASHIVASHSNVEVSDQSPTPFSRPFP